MKIKKYDAMKELGLTNPKPTKKSDDRKAEPSNDVIYDVLPIKWKKKYPWITKVLNGHPKKRD